MVSSQFLLKCSRLPVRSLNLIRRELAPRLPPRQAVVLTAFVRPLVLSLVVMAIAVVLPASFSGVTGDLSTVFPFKILG